MSTPRTLPELRNRLRALEADHAPTGWPAIRMQDISRLLDELDRINAQPQAAVPAVPDQKIIDKGLQTLRHVVQTLQETGRYIDDEGEDTAALADLGFELLRPDVVVPVIPSGLIEVLRGGRQCDDDGTEIIMSRQACCEAADLLEVMGSQPPAGQQDRGEEIPDDEIMRVVRYSTAGSGAMPRDEWIAFARYLLREYATRLTKHQIAVRLHDFPALSSFHSKHAMGTLVAPSCLCCGKSTHGLEIGVQHMELPGIVICKSCKDAAGVAPQSVIRGD